MKKQSILLKLLFATITFVMVATSCEKIDSTETPPKEEEKVFFDFATIGDYQFNIDYKLSVDVPVIFYVYDQYPFKPAAETPGMLVFKEGIEYISKAIASDFGKYSGTINIKKATKEVYVYSPTIGVISLLKAKLENNKFTIDANNSNNYVEEPTTKSATITQADLKCLILSEWTTGDNGGIPNNLLKGTISASLVKTIEASLPERSKTVPQANPQFIKGGVSASLKIIEKAKVELTFMSEGAMYRNSIGYFHYPTDNPPTSIDKITRILAFPNLSFKGLGGGLASGDKIQLKYWNGTSFEETFPPGVSIGWFLVADGYDKNSKNSVTNGKNVFYSLSQFNPESDPSKRDHNVLLYDPETQNIILGFEDLIRTHYPSTTDEDFNDALLYIKATPETSVELQNLPLARKSNDSDNDGIPDSQDEFPNNADFAYANHYPTENGFYTLAFEDLWPTKGDYDMNDVVVSYHSEHFMNGKNLVAKITDTWRPIWSGGMFNIGFGYQMGVASNVVRSVERIGTISDPSYYKTNSNGTESGQTKATIMVFDNIKDFIFKPDAKEKPSVDISTTFAIPQSPSSIMAPPYNPFIVNNLKVSANGKRVEVHLPNYMPTDLADTKLLGKENDRSDSRVNRYYIADENMPFAILIPTDKYIIPTECMRIDEFYPQFKKWTNSYGNDYKDWYLK